MNRDTIQKLLGGYATGTLTPEEQQALFAAALDDQELFDALAREQSLRDLLRDPAAKARVLMALDTAAPRWYRRRWWLPAAAAVAMAGVGLMAVVVMRRQAHAPAAVIVAEVKRAEVKDASPVPAPPLPDSRASGSLAKPVKPRALAQPQPKPAGVTNGIVGGVPSVELPPPPAVSAQVEVRADLPNRQQLPMFQAATASDANSLDSPLNARLLFYANLPARSAGTVGRAKSVASPAAYVGVRCSILRKRPNGELAEAALDTVLDSGEAVTLKLVPNGYGYLVIWEMGLTNEWRTLAKGPAEPHKAFETPLPNSDAGTGLVRGSGPRQLYVQFTRNGPLGLGAPSFQTLVTQAPVKLTQTAAESPDQATYIVNSASDPSSPSLMFTLWLNK